VVRRVNDCKNLADKMLNYVEGLLKEEEKQCFEKHLAGCDLCREELEELKSITSSIKRMPFPGKVCPDSELLVRFSENDVTFTEGREIKAHLEECLYCREEVTLLFELKQELSLEEAPCEIYEKKVMSPSLMSQVKEIYTPPAQISKYRPEFSFIKIFSMVFGRRKWVTALATCSLAVFMAVNGLFHLAPNYLAQEKKVSMDIVSKTSVSEEAAENESPAPYSLQDRDEGQAMRQVFPSESEKVSLSSSGEKLKEEKEADFLAESTFDEKGDGGPVDPGELEKSISEMYGISGAKVTLSGGEAKVKLYIEPGYTITSTQVSSIISLVSSGREGIAPENVSIYDSRGLVLSDNVLPTQNSQFSQLTVDQRLQQHNFEEVLTQNVQSALDKEFGPGNAVAQVSSSIEFITDEPIVIGGMEKDIEGYSYADKTAGNTVEAPAVTSVEAASEELSPSAPEDRKTDSSEDQDRFKKEQDIDITVEPPGYVQKLNVSVILNNVDYNESELAETVIKGTGMDYSRGDQLNIINTKFMEDENIVEQTFKPDTAVIEEKSFYNSPLLGIISLALAGILLFLGIRSIFGR